MEKCNILLMKGWTLRPWALIMWSFRDKSLSLNIVNGSSRMFGWASDESEFCVCGGLQQDSRASCWNLSTRLVALWEAILSPMLQRYDRREEQVKWAQLRMINGQPITKWTNFTVLKRGEHNTFGLHNKCYKYASNFPFSHNSIYEKDRSVKSRGRQRQTIMKKDSLKS